MTDPATLIIDDHDKTMFKVHRETMVSPEIFECERERIFDNVWLYLGHESEVRAAGDYKTRTLVGRPLILARGSDERIRVFVNSCPHRGAAVCREVRGNERTFRCFYHSWTFKNTGELFAVPGEDAYPPSFRKETMGLREVPRVTNYRGFVFISFNPHVEPLEKYLADARTYLDAIADQSAEGMEIITGTQLYSMRANWKLLVENTMDFYHTIPLHTTYFNYLKAQGTDLSPGVKGRGYPLGNGHAVVKFVAPWGRPIARWEPAWGEARREELKHIRADLARRVGEERAQFIADTDRNLLIFPNLLINDIMAIVLRQANPISADYMEVTQWALAPKDETAESRAIRLQSFLTFLGPGGMATPDDVEALESCQRGFAAFRELGWTDLSRGMHLEVSGRHDEMQSGHEIQLRTFYREWLRRMTQSPLAQPSAAVLPSAMMA